MNQSSCHNIIFYLNEATSSGYRLNMFFFSQSIQQRFQDFNFNFALILDLIKKLIKNSCKKYTVKNNFSLFNYILSVYVMLMHHRSLICNIFDKHLYIEEQFNA